MQVLEGQVIVPRVQGQGLGLHPLAVMLSVLCSGLLFGLPGALLAVPALAVFTASLPRMREAYRRSKFFRGDDSAQPVP
jgi:predicted PurR-regulated permease PerM